MNPLRSLQPQPIILAPMPKSASRTLLRSLEVCTNSKAITPKSGSGIGHFIIDRSALWATNQCIVNRKTPLIYQHFFPTKRNWNSLYQMLNISDKKPKVIVQVRNIFDVAMSCEDHQWKNYGPWGIMRGENDFFEKDGENHHSHFWNTLTCLKFYASWMIAGQQNDWDIKLVHYKDVVENKEQVIENIGLFQGIDLSKHSHKCKDIQENINKGKSGRGQELNVYYRDMLSRFAKSFKYIDFGPIGL